MKEEKIYRLSKSSSLKKFKMAVGQINHYIITILVGLDGVKNGKVEKEEGFSTVWSPKDVKISADRSREFALKAGLAWLVDNIDMYFILCNKEPKLIPDTVRGIPVGVSKVDKVDIEEKSFQQAFDAVGTSVYKKFVLYKEVCGLDGIYSSFVELAISWRNKMVHFNSDQDISHISKGRICRICTEDMLEIDNILKKDFIDLNDVKKSINRIINDNSTYYMRYADKYANIESGMQNLLKQHEQSAIRQETEQLKEYLKEINGYYKYNIDAHMMLERFEKGKAPSFKDMTTMVKGCIDFIYQLDEVLINQLDIRKYINEIFICYLKQEEKKRLDSIFSDLNVERKKKSIRKVLEIYGISYIDEESTKITDRDREMTRICNEFIEKICVYSYAEAKEKYSKKNMWP